MKKYFLAFIFCLTAIAGFSNSLSFQILQHADGLDEVSPTVLAFEDELLNYFFENGQIVSNEPAVVSVSKTKDEKLVNKSLDSAIEGAFNHFVQIDIFMNDSDGAASQNVKVKYLDKIKWKVFSVKQSKVLEEDSMKIKTKFGESDDFIRSIAVDIAVKLQKILKSKA